MSAVFDDLEDLKQYVRRAGKFLPEKIEMVQYEGRTAKESKLLFIDFKRDTDRARLAADVEIKVRIPANFIHFAVQSLLNIPNLRYNVCIAAWHVFRQDRAQ